MSFKIICCGIYWARISDGESTRASRGREKRAEKPTLKSTLCAKNNKSFQDFYGCKAAQTKPGAYVGFQNAMYQYVPCIYVAVMRHSGSER